EIEDRVEAFMQRNPEFAERYENATTQDIGHSRKAEGTLDVPALIQAQRELAERMMSMPRVFEAPYGNNKSDRALWTAMSDCADKKTPNVTVITPDVNAAYDAMKKAQQYRTWYPRLRDVSVDVFVAGQESPAPDVYYDHFDPAR